MLIFASSLGRTSHSSFWTAFVASSRYLWRCFQSFLHSSRLLHLALVAVPHSPSVFSALTKPTPSTDSSKLTRDARDTPQRRTRHRDGRQLRGGMGLTTGLGWSDSEDEDAPSALTRRVSSLAMSSSSSGIISRITSAAISTRSIGGGGRELRSAKSSGSMAGAYHGYSSGNGHPSGNGQGGMSRSSSQSSLRPFPSSMSRDTLLETEEEWEAELGLSSPGMFFLTFLFALLITRCE